MDDVMKFYYEKLINYCENDIEYLKDLNKLTDVDKIIKKYNDHYYKEIVGVVTIDYLIKNNFDKIKELNNKIDVYKKELKKINITNI